MRSTEVRLAKMEKVLSHVAAAKAAEAMQAEAAEWRAANGPVSFVCGDTEAAAWDRVETLRGLGMIQSIDKVHVLPTYPEFAGKHFARFEMLGEHKNEIIRFIRDNRDVPGRRLPPGWRLPMPAAGREA
jgi:hypothetical protein